MLHARTTHNPSRRRHAVLTGLVVLAAALGTASTAAAAGEPSSDSTAPGSTAPDATVPESTVPESTVPESTVPESTVPESTAVVPAAVVQGKVWFDRNGDGAMSDGEWALPGATVTLSPGSHSPDDPLMHLDGVDGRGMSEPAVQRSVTTAADGSYRFDGVEDGAYTVSASIVVPGFVRTADTDGSADWIVGIDAVGGAVVVADFSGVGSGVLTGQVFDSSTLDGLPAGAVTCRWAGPDDLAATSDDLAFATAADGDGRFELDGLPFGTYRCVGLDPVTGQASAPTERTVAGTEAVEAPLPIDAGSPATTVAAPHAHFLPATGGSLDRTPFVALALIGAGAAAMVAGRRRGRPAH